MYGTIEIKGARENNLKDVSLEIPKGKITVFTGVSGSGKSSLVFGTIAAESQRLINETFSAFAQQFLPRHSQPDADLLANLSAAIVVDQARMGGNSRSTVGTATDASTMLRLIFARMGEPNLGYPSAFSFNNPQGMCPVCEGIGNVSAVDLDVLFDWNKSLNEGAILFPGFEVGEWWHRSLVQSGFYDSDKPLKEFTKEEMDKLLYLSDGSKVKIDFGSGTMNSTYEGVIARLNRSYLNKETDKLKGKVKEFVERIATRGSCTACGGTRLNETARSSYMEGKNIADCAAMQVSDLAAFVRSLQEPSLQPMIDALAARLDSLVHIGLGYLSLDRESSTLSGGESQRVKMVRHLGSSLTDVTYIFDEPSVGLHPHDVHRMNELLVQLRDKGNTVLVVEHEPEVIALADHVVDMGPGAGRKGGEVVYQGSYPGLLASGTLTGNHMRRHQKVKEEVRKPQGQILIEGASLYNLRNVSVSIPKGVLTVVTGVAGSGKSTLIQRWLPKRFPDAVVIDQSLSRGSKRSNTATYTGILDPIRKAFASANKVEASMFSANSKGACPECGGIGVIYTDLAHLDPIATTCEACQGKRFTEEVLQYTLRGKNISEVFALSVVDATAFFTEKPVLKVLKALEDVGLGYVTLGQPLNTLSGGEKQRLKLAIEFNSRAGITILDEPTTGLHMNDVDNLIGLFDRLVDGGSTVIVIEHDLDVIARADWILDMGPGAGHDGGQVVFEGPPSEIVKCEASLTGRYLSHRSKGNPPIHPLGMTSTFL